MTIPQSAYDFIAKAASYFFVLLVVYILFRIVQNARQEYKYEKELKQSKSPFIGYLDVQASDDPELVGLCYGLRIENEIGASRRNDIRIRSEYIANHHAVIYSRSRRLYIANFAGREGVYVNGRFVKNNAPLLDGDIIQMGKERMRLDMESRERKENIR